MIKVILGVGLVLWVVALVLFFLILALVAGSFYVLLGLGVFVGIGVFVVCLEDYNES